MPNNINKVVFGDDTLIDLTNDTVSAENLLEGETAHDRSGNSVVGTAKQGHSILNKLGTLLTQRSKLKFGGMLKTTDDDTNGVTVVSDEAEEIEWSVWDAMTEAQRDAYSAGKKIDILHAPSVQDNKAPKTDIATVESGSTASRAYSVGELVYVNGNLYKVITAIANGATFTVGTNIQSTNVSDAIARPHFKSRQLLATFNVNGAIWTPDSDGFITIMLRDAVSTTQYAYVRPDSSSADPICTVTCLSGPQGVTFTGTAPVQKGQSYYLQTNVSDVPIYFIPFDV